MMFLSTLYYLLSLTTASALHEIVYCVCEDKHIASKSERIFTATVCDFKHGYITRGNQFITLNHQGIISIAKLEHLVLAEDKVCGGKDYKRLFRRSSSVDNFDFGEAPRNNVNNNLIKKNDRFRNLIVKDRMEYNGRLGANIGNTADYESSARKTNPENSRRSRKFMHTANNERAIKKVGKKNKSEKLHVSNKHVTRKMQANYKCRTRKTDPKNKRTSRLSKEHKISMNSKPKSSVAGTISRNKKAIAESSLRKKKANNKHKNRINGMNHKHTAKKTRGNCKRNAFRSIPSKGRSAMGKQVEGMVGVRFYRKLWCEALRKQQKQATHTL